LYAIHEFDSLRRGEPPADGKPVRGVGQGVIEIRIGKGRAFRVVAATGFDEAVYVLAVFEKKSRTMPRRVCELVRSRYRQLIREQVDRGDHESVQ
jgi:phage-related protein